MDEFLSINILIVRTFLKFSSFGFKPPASGFQKKGSGPGKSRSKQQSATAGCPGTPAEAGSRWTGNPEGVYVTIATSTLVWITGDNFR